MTLNVFRTINSTQRLHWEFNVYTGIGNSTVQAMFKTFSDQRRATPRHKWVTQSYFSCSHDRRDSTLKRDEVSIPDDVIEEARQQILDAIDFNLTGVY